MKHLDDYDDYRPIADFKGCMPVAIVIVVSVAIVIGFFGYLFVTLLLTLF
jgi:hypothetical protein